MLINASDYNYITNESNHIDIQHIINLNAITYRDTDKGRVLLPYKIDGNTTEKLKPLLCELALYGTQQTQPAFNGLYASNNYDDIIKSVSYRLHINIQPRRQSVSLYITITPTAGQIQTYHISCNTPQEEIQAIAYRYLAAGNELPFIWRGLIA